MKTFLKALGLLLAAGFLMTACEKPDADETAENTVNIINGVAVRFNISQFEQTPFNDGQDITRATNISDLCSRIQLAIFNGDSKTKAINQTKGDAGFGTFSLVLPKGTYQIVIIAHNGSGIATLTSPDKITFKENKVTDTFYYYAEIEISEDKQYDVRMKRAVAKFRMETEDNVPATIAQMKFYYTGGSSTFNAVTGFGCVDSRETELRTVSSDMIGKPGVFEIYTFPHSEEDYLKITITALGAGESIIQERVFEDVPVRRNTVTTWKGEFFDTSSETGEITFVLTTDDEWEQIEYSY